MQSLALATAGTVSSTTRPPGDAGGSVALDILRLKTDRGQKASCATSKLGCQAIFSTGLG